MMLAGGTKRASSGTRSSCIPPIDCRVAIFQRSKYNFQRPHVSPAEYGVIKRVRKLGSLDQLNLLVKSHAIHGHQGVMTFVGRAAQGVIHQDHA